MTDTDNLRETIAASGVSITELARVTGIPRSRLYRRFADGDWRATELVKVAAAIGAARICVPIERRGLGATPGKGVTETCADRGSDVAAASASPP